MLRHLFPSRGVPVTRAVSTTSTVGWTLVKGADLHNPAQTGNTVRLQGWERHPVVQACARVIVDTLAAVPFEVYRIDGDGNPVVQPQHEALGLLQTPQGALSPYRLRARTGMAFVLYGNAFWYLDRGRSRRGLPKALRIVSPERVQYAWTNERDEIVKYDWRDASGNLMPQTPAEDMVHFRDLDARDGFFGYPRGAAALLDIDSDTKASQFVRQVLNNDGTPTLLLEVEGNAMSQEDLTAAEVRWREKQATRGERGNTRILQGLKAVHQLGFNLNDLEFPDLRGIARESICAAFGVDPRMIGLQSAGNDAGLSGTQFREARTRLIHQTVLPVMRAMESELNTWLMPEFGDVYVRFRPDEIADMTEDATAISTRVVGELASGLRTVEEAREVVGLDPEMDDTHHLALSAVALKQVKAAMEDSETTAAQAAEHAAALAAASRPDDDAGDVPAQRNRSLVRAGAIPVTMHGELSLPPAPPLRKSVTFTRADDGTVTGANIIEDTA